MLDLLPLVLLIAVLGAVLWVLVLRVSGRGGSRLVAALRVVAAVAIALVVVGAGAYELSRARSVQVLGDLVTHVDTSRKVVALTFDDGPDSVCTRQVLNTLARYDAKATFFVVGRDSEACPASLRALASAGHEIGNHTYSHSRLLAMSQAAIADEIESTDAIIRGSGYEGPILVRPPGCKRLLAAPYYLWRHDRVTVTWSLEPDSVAGIAADSGAIADYVHRNVTPGSIILLHVWYGSRRASREALPHILEDLRDQGYRFVTVSELMALRAR